MKELNFLAQWGDSRQKAWSGTTLSIFNALGEHYKLTDCPLRSPQSNNVFTRFTRRIKRRFFYRPDLDLGEIKRNRKYYKKIRGNTFQFAEVLPTTSFRPTFIYQDLSVSFLKEMISSGNPNFNYSGFQSVPFDIIRKRTINTSVIF